MTSGRDNRNPSQADCVLLRTLDPYRPDMASEARRRPLCNNDTKGVPSYAEFTTAETAQNTQCHASKSEDYFRALLQDTVSKTKDFQRGFENVQIIIEQRRHLAGPPVTTSSPLKRIGSIDRGINITAANTSQ